MSHLTADKHAGVLHIKLTNPAQKNTFNASVYRQLTGMLGDAIADAAVHVVAVSGDRAIFSAGNDVSEFANADHFRPDAPVFDFVRAMATFPKPIIAGVCGPAIGIGMTLLLHCDLVIAGDNAKFRAPFVELGVCPEAGSSLLLGKRVGYGNAAQILMFGRSLMAREALASGLVQQVLPPDKVEAELLESAQRAARSPLSSLMETKRLMKLVLTRDLTDQIDEEAVSFYALIQGPPAQEALEAFKTKRSPDFSGL